MTRVITVLNQKGGVGKSTLTVNLAAIVAERLNPNLEERETSPVVIVSVDPQGTALWWTDQLRQPPYEIFQWDPVSDTLAELRNLHRLEGVEYVFVDTPGWFDLSPADARSDGLGQGRGADAMRAVVQVADEVIVPVEPEILQIDPTIRAVEKLLIPYDKRFTIVVNRWDAGKGDKNLRETREALLQRRLPVADTPIRRYQTHSEAAAYGWTVIDYVKNLPKSRRSQSDEAKKPPDLKAAEDFYNLAEELFGLGFSVQSDRVEVGV